MVIQYRCQNQRRLQTVRTQIGVRGKYLNGIDYLEVLPDRQGLVLHLLQELASSDSLTGENVLIQGAGQSVQIGSTHASGRRFTVIIQGGDKTFSQTPYSLRLVESPEKLAWLGEIDLADRPPPEGFDRQLSQVKFSFQTEAASEFDCQPVPATLESPQPLPNIDYLAKDYASFRQLMLDRLAVILPQWKERSPADIGIMLVELLAYRADHLSYYQDAVATEAYLTKARQRISVRRHARLLDYFLHEGCNARTWIALTVKPGLDGRELPGPTGSDRRPTVQFFTQVPGLPLVLDKESKSIRQARNAGAQVFEPLHPLTLYAAANEIRFYTWGEENCELPIGATQATLEDTGGKLREFLVPGRVLILEEKRNLSTGETSGVDPTRRQAVRLTKVTPQEDPLFAEANAPEGQAQRLSIVEWGIEDALTFSLCLTKIVNGHVLWDMAVVRGNVLLADCGRTHPDTALSTQDIEQRTKVNEELTVLDEEKLNRVPNSDRYRPRLTKEPLTYQGYVLDRDNQWRLFDPAAAAKAALTWNLKPARPSLTLRQEGIDSFEWQWQPDLLNSDRFARDFVVETEEGGRAYLRFGDDLLGKRPEPDSYLQVTYRTGNGAAGNVGAEAIAHLADCEGRFAAILREGNIKENLGDLMEQVRNPLPAQGGTDPEDIEAVRLEAPQAFRTQQRAVTAKDYAQFLESQPEVQRAIGTRRWTGSSYTIFLTVDRQGGGELDDRFRQSLLAFLEPFRMAGHELAIEEPRYVPLDIALQVKVKSGYFRAAVKQALLETFNSQNGFFSPDKLSFGEPLYLSQVINTTMKVQGVQSVNVTRFQRWRRDSRDELTIGRIAIAPLEIVRLDNDPTAVERGRLVLEMEGGL